MDVGIVIVGDEILQGHTQDTNSHELAQRLDALGIDLVEVRTVHDTQRAIQESIYELQERRRVEAVIVAGGLGPTHDDRTVKAVANLHGVDVVLHEPSWQRLVERYRARDEGAVQDLGIGQHAAARKMTSIPRGASAFVNPVGGAPTFVAERRLRTRDGTAYTLVVPGVPSELRGCWDAHMGPWLAQKAGTTVRRRHMRELHYHGYEAVAAEHLEQLEDRYQGISIGSYPKAGKTLVVLRIAGRDEPTVEKATKDLAQRLQAAGLDVDPAPPRSGPSQEPPAPGNP